MTQLDSGHDTAASNVLPSMSRHPSVAAAVRAVGLTSSPRSRNVVRIGTRGSALAIVQATAVKEGLERAMEGSGISFELAPMSVAGDRNKVEPLYLMGGKALWTKDLEVALVADIVDCIVHSLKDVPTSLPDGCELAAVTKREDPRDAFVAKAGSRYTSLGDLPAGSCVGSSSVRRVAQMRRAYPHLTFKDCRGNIDTRLNKLDAPDGPFDALILASAGLLRTNQGHRITASLSSPTMLHAVGQGAIGIEIRSSDDRMRGMLARLNDVETEWRTAAERTMLRVLEGGCSVPVGVETELERETGNTGSSTLTLKAVIASLDGQTCIQHTISRPVSSRDEAEQVGTDMAAHLIDRGGQAILEELGRIVESKNVSGVNDAVAMQKKQAAAPSHSTLAGGRLREQVTIA